MVQVKDETVTKTQLASQGQLDKKVKKSAENDADGWAVDLPKRREKDDAEDNAKVVDQRSKGRNQKPTLRLENAGEKRRGGKEKLSSQHQADKVGKKGKLRGRVSRSNQAAEETSKDKNEKG